MSQIRKAASQKVFIDFWDAQYNIPEESNVVPALKEL